MATFTACCFVTAVIHTDLVNAYQLRHYVVVISSLFNLAALLHILRLPKPCGLLQKGIKTISWAIHSFGHATTAQSHITSILQKFGIISCHIRSHNWFLTEVKPLQNFSKAKQTLSWTIQNKNQQFAVITNNRAFHKRIWGIILLMLKVQQTALAQLILAYFFWLAQPNLKLLKLSSQNWTISFLHHLT